MVESLSLLLVYSSSIVDIRLEKRCEVFGPTGPKPGLASYITHPPSKHGKSNVDVRLQRSLVSDADIKGMINGW